MSWVPTPSFISFQHYHQNIQVLVAKLARHKAWQAERVRRELHLQHSDNQFGKTTAAWPLQYDISPGEGNFTWNVRANIDRDRPAIEVIHYWALIMVPLMEPPGSLCKSPSTPLGFEGAGMTVNDVSDDGEDEWLLAEPSRSRGGAHRDLMHHLQICLPSPRAKIKPSAWVIAPSGTTLL